MKREAYGAFIYRQRISGPRHSDGCRANRDISPGDTPVLTAYTLRLPGRSQLRCSLLPILWKGHSPVGLQSVRPRFPHPHRGEILPSPCRARLLTASPTPEADESHPVPTRLLL